MDENIVLCFKIFLVGSYDSIKSYDYDFAKHKTILYKCVFGKIAGSE